MNRAAPVPGIVTQQGRDFYLPAVVGYRPVEFSQAYLLPTETEWWGPHQGTEDHIDSIDAHLQMAADYAKFLRPSGISLHVKRVGCYVRSHRLSTGPVYKLSDWKELPAGERMLLDPAPTDEGVEAAVRRAGYLRDKGVGRYRSWTDDGGALWVERVSP